MIRWVDLKIFSLTGWIGEVFLDVYEERRECLAVLWNM
jgi:hypothetical protein